MGRRAKGEGSIQYHPARGDWSAVLELPRGPDGARRRHTFTGPTRAAVLAQLRAAQRDPAAVRSRHDPPGLTLAAALPLWLDGHPVRPQTRRTYAWLIRAVLSPALGSIPLRDLSAAQIRAWLVHDTHGARTRQAAFRVLRAMLGQAARDGQVPANVAALVRAPAAPRADRARLSLDAARALLDAAEATRWAPLWSVALGTGMRQGELLAVRWADVDWTAGTLTVAGAWDSRTHTRQAPKTVAGRRVLPLSEPVRTALRAAHRAQAADRLVAGPGWQDNGLCFTTHTGAPLSANNVYRAWRQACAAAAVGPYPMHDTRHLAITLWSLAGVPLTAAQALAGHASIRTTADIYSHVVAAEQRTAMDALGAALAGK